MGAGSNLNLSGMNDSVAAATGDTIRVGGATVIEHRFRHRLEREHHPSGLFAPAAPRLERHGDGGRRFNLAIYGSTTRSPRPRATGSGCRGDRRHVTGAGFAVYAAAGTMFTVGGASVIGTTGTVNGSNVNITLQASSHLQLHGSNDAVTVSAGSNLAIYGSNNSVAATTGDGIWMSSGTGDTITGAGFTVYAAAGTGFAVGGNGFSGVLDNVNGSSASVTLQANSNIALTGANDAVTMGAGSSLSVYGMNGSVAAASATRSGSARQRDRDHRFRHRLGRDCRPSGGFALAAPRFERRGDGPRPARTSDLRLEQLGGRNHGRRDLDVVGKRRHDHRRWLTVYAAADTGLVVGGASVIGTTDTVYGSNARITLQASSHLQLHGSNDAVSVGAGSNLAIYGSMNSVAATTGDGIWMSSGIGDTITGAGFTVYASAGTGFAIKGTADVVYAGINDSITDSGSSTLFKIGSNVGNLAVSGFGADPTGIIDLLNGVGGYSSASQALPR